MSLAIRSMRWLTILSELFVSYIFLVSRLVVATLLLRSDHRRLLSSNKTCDTHERSAKQAASFRLIERLESFQMEVGRIIISCHGNPWNLVVYGGNGHG
jgi:hypothetical protein